MMNLFLQVVDNQKDELMIKATKAKGRRVVNSTELTSMNSKTNSDVLNDDIVRKVTVTFCFLKMSDDHIDI